MHVCVCSRSAKYTDALTKKKFTYFHYLYYLIETLRQCNYKATAVHEILQKAWPNGCLSVRRIQEICKELKEGTRTSFEIIEDPGRPSSELRRTNTEEVSKLIEDDPAWRRWFSGY